MWIAISTLLVWIRFFEIGLGNGLKNRLSEALAKDDIERAKSLVSSAYFFITIIICGALLCFFSLMPMISWQELLNTTVVSEEVLSGLMIFVILAFFLQLGLKLIVNILHATQDNRWADILGLISNILILFVVFVLVYEEVPTDLKLLGLVVANVPVVIYVFATVITFSKSPVHKKIRPSISAIKKSMFGELFGLGSQFFIIQISMLVLFQSANFIVLKNFGPEDVVVYNTAVRYYSVTNMAFTLLLAPIWPAVTESWHRGEINWIRKRVRMLLLFWSGMVVALGVQFYLQDFLIELWLGEPLPIPNSLSLALMAYYLLFNLGGVFNMVINALSKVRVQMIALFIGAMIFIPLSKSLIHFTSLGLASIAVATIFSNFYSVVIAPIHYRKLIYKKANGIWNK